MIQKRVRKMKWFRSWNFTGEKWVLTCMNSRNLTLILAAKEAWEAVKSCRKNCANIKGVKGLSVFYFNIIYHCFNIALGSMYQAYFWTITKGNAFHIVALVLLTIIITLLAYVSAWELRTFLCVHLYFGE